MKHARGNFVIIMDADLSHHVSLPSSVELLDLNRDKTPTLILLTLSQI